MGLLIGLLIGVLAWAWLAWLGVIVAVVMLGALHLVSKTHIHGVHGVPAVHVSMGGLFWLLVLVIGAIGGGIFGRVRGLPPRRGSEIRPPMTKVQKASTSQVTLSPQDPTRARVFAL